LQPEDSNKMKGSKQDNLSELQRGIPGCRCLFSESSKTFEGKM